MSFATRDTTDRQTVAARAGLADVRRDVYTDPRVFELELERIFHGTWVYVAHASQVRHAGDYVTTRLGTEPVILSRSEDGELHLLSVDRTTGRRRRSQGCSVTATGRCVGRNSGALTGVPFPKGYGDRVGELRSRGLERVRHVEERHGLVFAHAGEPQRTLAEHLAPLAGYLERFERSVPGGTVQVFATGSSSPTAEARDR